MAPDALSAEDRAARRRLAKRGRALQRDSSPVVAFIEGRERVLGDATRERLAAELLDAFEGDLEAAADALREAS